jgi:uncharacterized membrane protein
MEELLLFFVGAAAFVVVFILPLVNFFRIGSMKEHQADGFTSLRKEMMRLQKAVADLTAATTAKATPPVPPVMATPVQEVAEEIELVIEPEPTPPAEPIKPVGTPFPTDVPPVMKLPESVYRTSAASLGESVSPKPHRPTFEPLPPREPSKFELAAKETLQKIWNWILVGDEYIPEGKSREFAIASHWFLRVAVLLFLLGIGYFLNYSIERGILGPQARVLLSTITGLALLVGGTQIVGKKFNVLGQGLMGAGLATLYFSVFAAANFYKLIDPIPAFALMGLITVLAGFIAVRFNSMLVAVLGIIGGYGTPVMLSTGAVDFVGLFSYMLILGIGVLGICYWKNWPLVNYLSFFATYALFFTAMQAYKPEHFHQVMPFLVAFFVLFSTMVFLYKVVRKAKSNLLDLIALFVNAGIFFAVSYRLIDELYDRRAVAIVTLGLVAFYIAHIFLFIKRKLVDRELLVSLLGLSSFFLAITMPLVLSNQWITASWAVQAVVLLWVAEKIGSQFVRHIALVLFGVVLIRFCTYDISRQFYQNTNTGAELAVGDYMKALIERVMAFGVPIASFVIGYRMLGKQLPLASGVVSRDNDVEPWLPQASILHIFIFAAMATCFLYLHMELNRTVGVFYAPARLPVLTLLWVGLCAYFLYNYAKGVGGVAFLGLLGLALVGLMVKLVMYDLSSWGFNQRFIYSVPYSFRDALMRLVDFGAVIGFLVGGYSLFTKRETPIPVRPILGFASLAMLFVYLTLEVNSYLYHNNDGLRAGGISVLWALFAIVLVWQGIARREAVIRYLGLALFAIVTAKVFMVDLANSDPIWRIVALMVLGVLFFAGAFLYFREPDKVPAATTDSEELS